MVLRRIPLRISSVSIKPASPRARQVSLLDSSAKNRSGDPHRPDVLRRLPRVSVKDNRICDPPRNKRALCPLFESRRSSAKRVRGHGLVHGEPLPLKGGVHGPVNPFERAVRHAVGTEREGHALPENFAVRVVESVPFRTEPPFVQSSGEGPVPDEIRLARGDNPEARHPSDLLGMEKLGVLDSMSDTWIDRERLDRLDHDLDRPISNRVHGGGKARGADSCEDVTELNWRVDEHPPLQG